MTDKRPVKRSLNRRKFGLVLLITPFVAAIVAGAMLYFWVISNDYQGSESVAYAWVVYAISFLAYYGPALLGLGLIMVVSGFILIVTRK